MIEDFFKVCKKAYAAMVLIEILEYYLLVLKPRKELGSLHLIGHHGPVKEIPEITKVSLVHPEPNRSLDIPVNIELPGMTNNR